MKRATAIFAIVVTLLGVALKAYSAPPEPWGKMDSPSGCTFGVIAASWDEGVWCVTCKHCVKAGQSVKLRFWQDGRESPVFVGRCVRHHPTADASLIWVDAQQFRKLPQFTPLAKNAPYRGQVVVSVGTNASGTRTPARQTTYVLNASADGMAISLREWPWGGHSGGPVVDATTGRLLGVVATRHYSNGKFSGVVGLRAIYELVYEVR